MSCVADSPVANEKSAAVRRPSWDGGTGELFDSFAGELQEKAIGTVQEPRTNRGPAVTRPAYFRGQCVRGATKGIVRP
jgi:hypothetical protein